MAERRSIKDIISNFIPPLYVVKRQKGEDGIDGYIIPYVDKYSYIAEQYKVLRTNIYSLSPGKPIKTILLTSAQPEEGKTITSCNLAATLSADTEKKTVLIDCDLRKPNIHKLFNIPRVPGFSDIINNKADMSQFIDKPAVRNMYIIPAGSSSYNLSESISSSKTKEIIQQLKSNFDYVVFDSPPVLSVTDACILGALCDAVLLVVKAEITQKSVIKEAFELLRNAQAKPAATVLINVVIPYYNYYKYRYSYKYNYGRKR